MASCHAVMPNDVQVALALQQCGEQVLASVDRGTWRLDHVHRTLVQRPGRLTSCVALDAAVCGSGVVASMPAISSALVFTQAPWWSRFGRKTGRSETTLSRSAAGRRPSGERRHGPSAPSDPLHVRMAVGIGADGGDVFVEGQAPRQVARIRSSPPPTGCTCASWKPGTSKPPSRSTTSGLGPASSRMSSPPTATIRPSRTTTVVASGPPAAAVKTAPFVNTRSGMGEVCTPDRELSGRDPFLAGLIPTSRGGWELPCHTDGDQRYRYAEQRDDHRHGQHPRKEDEAA